MISNANSTPGAEENDDGDVRQQGWRRAVLLQKLLEQESRCFYCDWTIEPNHMNSGRCATLDHFFPRAHGGSDDPANLVASCRRCNQLKADHIWERACMTRNGARPVNLPEKVKHPAGKLTT